RSGWGAYRQQLDAGLLSPGAKVSLPVHPVQLYETVFLWVLFGLLLWAYPRRKRHGDIFLGYLVLYGLGRFLLETMRGDEPRHVLGLTATQFVCMAMVAGGLAALAWLPRKPAGDADPPGTPGLDTSPAMNTAPPGTGPEAGE
ncbi:MAG TPA: prolipoprotein diacylglyceryl transferase, partial [Candidatus Hydrogenedentes bacterium]|nr:prolipoprotein diacylglyceryl transferase [Candidatus Hydrogenedentota bacterium]